jgi:hypothetical protein
MKLRKLSTTTMAIAAATAACAIAAPAKADTRYGGSRHTDYTDPTPNADLIASGLFTLAVPYVASVVVATESSRQGDYYLYTPVAGPWLNLAHRADCPPTGTCANETAYKILLVADGVLQGFGALEILSGFMFPETHPTTAEAPRVRVVPSVATGGAGVTALGRF